MEELKEEGLTKSIGVSNYREEDLLEMEKTWKIPPAVNQVSPLASTPSYARLGTMSNTPRIPADEPFVPRSNYTLMSITPITYSGYSPSSANITSSPKLTPR